MAGRMQAEDRAPEASRRLLLGGDQARYPIAG